jgi:accessory gene regulator B
MIHDLAVRLASTLSAELKTTRPQAVMAYGLEIIIGALVKLACFVALPLALGILPQVAAAFLAGSAFRLAAGGAHCTAFYRCLASSLAVFCCLGFLARYLGSYSLPVKTIVAGTAMLSLLIALRLAPADTPAKPITNPVYRKRLKMISLAVITTYTMVMLSAPLPAGIVLAASFGLLAQVFTITPVGYRFIDVVDRLLLKIHLLLTTKANPPLRGLRKKEV